MSPILMQVKTEGEWGSSIKCEAELLPASVAWPPTETIVSDISPREADSKNKTVSYALSNPYQDGMVRIEMETERVFVKKEIEGQQEEWGCNVTMDALVDELYAGHTVKQDLVLGPETIQAPYVAARVSGASAEDCPDHGLTSKTCSVKLERIPAGKDPSARGELLCEQDSTDKYLKPRPGKAELLSKIQIDSPEVPGQYETQLSEHVHVDTKKYECNICNAQFRHHASMARHLRIHTGQKYACNVCSKQFSRLDKLKRHNRTHTGQEQFKCDVCNREFNKIDTLISHKRIHTGEKYACNVCSKQFSKLYRLNNHSRTHTGEKPFKCDICNKEYCKKDSLISHKRIHTGETPFTCDICSKQFRERVSLKNHKLVHMKARPYACNVCNKQFKRKDKLKSHKLIHTGVRPFECDSCNKRFIRKDHVDAHKRIHTGEKPYACDVCNKRFNQKTNWFKHGLIHAKERFACDICVKKFPNKTKLKRHRKNHTGNKLYICDICDYQCNRKSYLILHIRIHS